MPRSTSQDHFVLDRFSSQARFNFDTKPTDPLTYRDDLHRYASDLNDHGNRGTLNFDECLRMGRMIGTQIKKHPGVDVRDIETYITGEPDRYCVLKEFLNDYFGSFLKGRNVNFEYVSYRDWTEISYGITSVDDKCQIIATNFKIKNIHFPTLAPMVFKISEKDTEKSIKQKFVAVLYEIFNGTCTTEFYFNMGRNEGKIPHQVWEENFDPKGIR